jgi:hypothetical protein
VVANDGLLSGRAQDANASPAGPTWTAFVLDRAVTFHITGPLAALGITRGGREFGRRTNGIRARVPIPPRAFASESRTYGVLSQRASGRDGNLRRGEPEGQSDSLERSVNIPSVLGRADCPNSELKLSRTCPGQEVHSACRD